MNTGTAGVRQVAQVTPTEEWTVDLPIGTYADMAAIVTASGYAGTLTKVHSIQVTAEKGGYSVTGQGEQGDPASNESFLRVGNSVSGTQLRAVKDFELVVDTDVVNVRLELF